MVGTRYSVPFRSRFEEQLADRPARMYNPAMTHERIEIDSKVHLGKPCVRGTRIPVDAVLELVAAGIPFQTICADYYPDLAPEDVKACVEYALDVVRTEEIHVARQE